MSQNDLLASALSKILNAEKTSKKECEVKSSKVVKRILEIMKDKGYIGGFEEKDGGRGPAIRINLLRNINRCGAIKPRYPIKVEDFERYEKRYLVAKGFGHIMISTPKGIMTLEDAKKKRLGGKLLAYCY